MVWSWPHIHLMLNGFPVFGLPLGLILVAAVFLTRKEAVARVARWYLIIVCLLTIPAYIAGDLAEESIQVTSEVTHGAIHYHQYAANIALAAALGLAIWIWLAGTMYRRWNLSQKQEWTITFVLTVLAIGVFSIAALRGGSINHPEIREPGFAEKIKPFEHEPKQEPSQEPRESKDQ